MITGEGRCVQFRCRLMGTHQPQEGIFQNIKLIKERITCNILLLQPWQGKHSMKVINMVENGGRLPLAGNPVDTPPELVSLMLSCWEQVYNHD